MGDDDSETMGDYWRAVTPGMKERSKAKRANNREQSAELLRAAGVPFESKNSGAHLIVDGRFDFWPGTGLWIERDGRGERKRNRGIRNLLKRVKK
jgi:hypothetical protein